MLKILLADDEEIIRRGLQNIIPWEQHGIEVMGTATNGLDALNKILQQAPDLLITDINMPLKDGIQLLTELRQRDIQIPTIFLTGYNEFEYARKGIELGICSYILKPVDPEELIAIVDSIKKTLEAEKLRQAEYRNLKRRFDNGVLLLKENEAEDSENFSSSPNFSNEYEKSNPLMMAIKKYIDDNYTKPLTLVTISDQFLISPSYLSVAFKKETGFNVIEYLCLVRISHSKEFLLNPIYKVYEVCHMVGIEDSQYFSKLFKKYTGISPTDYKRKYGPKS